MAKRKRLTPPDPTRMPGDGGLETKSLTPYPMGVAVAQTRRAAPIADVAADASSAAALDEMADTLRRVRDQGRMIVELPLDRIEAGYLVRDRIVVNDDEMQALKSSLAARGQQTPIEVVELEDGRYGLISGWRRLTALRDLQNSGETDTVLALLRRPDDSAEAYQAMVEENEIRVGLSYFERARIAAKAVEQGVFETHKKALLTLFAAASRSKRSKIRSFLIIVEALDGALRFPEAISERQGLALAQALEERPKLWETLRLGLLDAAPDTPEAERALIDAALQAGPRPEASAPSPAPAPSVPDPVEIRPGMTLRTAKTGALTLSGEAVTADLREALIGWLQRGA